jgi:hypothetical protein
MKRRVISVLSAVAVVGLFGCNQQMNQSQKAGVTAPGNKAFALTYPKDVVIRPGESKTLQVHIERNGIDDAIAVDISQLPTGVTALDSPAKIPQGSNNASITLKASENAKPEAGASFKLTAHAGSVQAGPYEVRIDIEEKGATTARSTTESKPATDDHEALKKELKTSIKAKLDASDAAIKTLEENAKTAKGDAKKDIDNEIASLKSKRDSLQRHYDEVEATGPTTWDKFKNDATKAADDLMDATKRAIDRFKK